MYPERIISFKKNETTGAWKESKRLDYLSFKPIFNEVSIVNLNLPYGLGCRRFNPEKYPQILSNYGKRFELEHSIQFNYTSLEKKDKRLAKKNNFIRFYTSKIYVDLDSSSNVADTIDEFTNASIRNIYNTNHLLHSIDSTNDKCVTYNLTSSNKEINWFYVQESFVKKPEIFYTSSKYSYLGEHKIDDVQYLVFEKSLFIYKPDDYLKKGKNNSTTNLKSQRKNKNGLKCERAISTHFYPKEIGSWSGNSNELLVPKRIEIRLFNSTRRDFISKLTLDVNNFSESPKEPEKYDTSKCTLTE